VGPPHHLARTEPLPALPQGTRVLVRGSSREAVTAARDLWDRGAVVSLSLDRPPALLAPWRARRPIAALWARLPRRLAARLDGIGRRDLRPWDWPLPHPDESSADRATQLIDEGISQLVRQGAVVVYPAEVRREPGPDGVTRVWFADGRADTFDVVLAG
jgi:hypothetical protein